MAAAAPKKAAPRKTAKKKEQATKVEIRYVPDAKVGECWLKVQQGDDSGFLPPEELEVIDSPGFLHTLRAANHPRNLEQIYKTYQRVSGSPEERTEQLGKRSMSVGDAIVIENVAYYVAKEGFVHKDPTGKFVPVSE